MTDEIAIRVRDVSKCYLLYRKPQDRLKQSLFARFGKNFGRPFWALREVSFDLAKGQTLGIMGRNGAGKSTLLEIIAGTVTPTTGTVEVRGRIAALLELGSGFNPNFTGRENVYFNGAILGFDQKEMDTRFDEIADFADIGEFMDQPVKIYSSGMFVRLAFAVQACVQPDVLIVDEALSVGDIFFRQKCHRRIEKLLEHGTAVILVSHDMSAIQKYCRDAMVLDRGGVVFQGPSAEATSRYLTMTLQPAADGAETGAPARTEPLPASAKTARLSADAEREISLWPEPRAFKPLVDATTIGGEWARCSSVALCDASLEPCGVFTHGQRAFFFFEFEALKDLLVPFGAVILTNGKNIIVHAKTTYQHLAPSFRRVAAGSSVRFRMGFDLNLRPEPYTFDVLINMMRPEDYASLENMSATEIQSKVMRLTHIQNAGVVTVVPPRDGSVALKHFGVCDLPGECEIGLVLNEHEASSK